jgi:acyl-CoA thioester hydrolase
MKEYSFNYDVHIFDTDCYGVVWHGSYTKWLEMGRVNLFKTIDVDMKQMSDEHDIVFPVTEQNIRFRAPARFGDVLRLTTWVKPDQPKLIFYQEIHHLHNDKLIVEARTDVVMINTEGKMYRRFPQVIEQKLKDL